jgi:Flp pilus assembly protein TadG
VLAHSRSRNHGQVIVIFAIALVVIVAGIGLVIDAGAAFAQQRVAQNGSDATATAGTVVIAQNLSGIPRSGADVRAAVDSVAAANGLTVLEAEYTDDLGNLIGQSVTAAGSIPTNARGVHVSGSRNVTTTFSRVLGITQLTPTADATVAAGALSGECVAEDDGCTLLPVTFPVKTFECDSSGNLLTGTWVGAPPPGHGGEDYWPIVGLESLPSTSNPTGDTTKMAILPLCRGSGTSTGTFGWLDLVSGMNLAQEITGPLDADIDLPDWFQAQTGNPNSVEDELEAYIHQPVLIPLHNQACRIDPGDTAICPSDKTGVDPTGNNTWYYVHTLAVFYIDQVLVQGSNVSQCASPPGSPLVPVTTGTGFLGCLKGWFVNYVTAGPIQPGGVIIPGQTPIGIQLIR